MRITQKKKTISSYYKFVLVALYKSSLSLHRREEKYNSDGREKNHPAVKKQSAACYFEQQLKSSSAKRKTFLKQANRNRFD